MDLISGENSSLFIRYSGIDIWVSLVFRFSSCCVTVFYFFFCGVSFFSFFLFTFFVFFPGRRKRKRFVRQ